MRYIGDVHGKFSQYELLIGPNISESIQVGDMGVGFPDYRDKPFPERIDKTKHRFIRGNHDNPATCRSMSNWINDGTIEDAIMYIGGAWSIDYEWRTPGLTWWGDEELSYSQLNNLLELYGDIKPAIMITHDCPESVQTTLFPWLNNAARYRTRTSSALDSMFQIHKPDLWIFGHWHEHKNMSILGTRFICLAELDFIDI